MPERDRRAPSFARLGGRDDVPASAARLDLNTAAAEQPGFAERLAGVLATVDLSAYGNERALPLREAIGASVGAAPEEGFVAGGSMAVLRALLAGFGGEGATVLTFAPGYAGVEALAAALGMGVESAPRDQAFRIGPEEVAAAIGRVRPDVVLFCNPGNPGAVTEDRRAVERACAEAPEALVVVDEAYVEFAPEGSSIQPLLASAPNLVVVRTFSKARALAGARLGYALARPEIVEDLFAGELPGAVSGLTQAAGIAALAEDSEAFRERIAAVVAERDRLSGDLAAIDGVEVFPSESNFVLFRLDPGAGVDPAAVADACADAGVLIRDVSGRPGLERCLRVTVGRPVDHDAVVAAVATATSAAAGAGTGG